MGVTVILTGIVAAVASAVGYSKEVTQSQAERYGGTVGIVSGVVVVLVLLVGYYAGGYVAGRMSRFDGAKQGVGVWVLGLVVTLLAVAAGWIAGSSYNVLDRVNLPRIPIPQDQLTLGGVIVAVVLLLGTLAASVLGGKAGHRYHDKVDFEAYRW